ncbi:MAG: ribosome-associated translation inhibitor RaiA, partial [Gammaproteobacteria bacterium]|nr:ribosome-associated translation inhibitor RaiA [Gammaproteobacteria bacterium]MXY06695.1 ribosome-associated translation inhibitor RaiA [Gammaproteobacteria bacterium]
DQITNLHVVLSVEKLSQKAEATAHVSGAELFADAVADDLYAAIDMLLDKLDRQVIKHKEKAIERHHGRG